MKLYLDTADPDHISRHLGSGLFRGVTCNPVILKAAGLGPGTARQYYRCAAELGASEIFLQTFGKTVDDQIEQALRYCEYGPEIVIKVVASRTGLTVCRRLRQRDVPVLLTAVHDAKQTITAMAADATYITPYLSEMYRAGRDGLEHVGLIQRILGAADTRTRLVMAGLADVPTLVRIAEMGVGFVTVTPDLADALLSEALTEDMAALFEEASLEG